MGELLPADVLQALNRARRTCGWNFRELPIQRFKISRGACTLIVVPARVWAFRRWEKAKVRVRAAARLSHGGKAA